MGKIFILILFTSNLVFSQCQEELLNKAFEQKSYELLDRFFENWRMEKKPISDEEYQKLSDIEKDVYDVFYEFYNPKDMSNLKLEEFEYNYYKNVKYFVINPEIHYGVLKSDNYDSLLRNKFPVGYKDSTFNFNMFYDRKDKRTFEYTFNNLLENELFDYFQIKDSIENFRPQIKDKSTNILFYSCIYDSIISNFIGNNIIPLGENSIMQPAYAHGISKIKIDFLKPYIFTMASHWGNQWVIETSPMLYRICFSNNRTFARISHNTPYHSNRSYYVKIENKWTFVFDDDYMYW
jgi:hypothetical protein